MDRIGPTFNFFSYMIAPKTLHRLASDHEQHKKVLTPWSLIHFIFMNNKDKSREGSSVMAISFLHCRLFSEIHRIKIAYYRPKIFCRSELDLLRLFQVRKVRAYKDKLFNPFYLASHIKCQTPDCFRSFRNSNDELHIYNAALA